MKEKHPIANHIHHDILLNGPLKSVPTSIFDSITPELIRKMALRTKGAAGPSMLDADEWRRMLGSKLFKDVGVDLSKADRVEDLSSLIPLLACRLIPLDKCPGLRPIGIGEVLRRIIAKAITFNLNEGNF